MKKVVLLMILSFSSNVFSEFFVGRGLLYTSRVRGDANNFTRHREIVTQRDEDFDSHYIKYSLNSQILAEGWAYDEDKFRQLTYLSTVFNQCQNYDGTYESVNVASIPYITCKLDRVYPLNDLIFIGGDYLRTNDAAVWIGNGPHNGIFKVIDYKTNTMYQLRSFN